MARLTLPGALTNPSSAEPPSFPAAATTKIPSSIACRVAETADPLLRLIDLVHHPMREMMSASKSKHQRIASPTLVSEPVLLSPSALKAAAIPNVTLGAMPI